MCDAASMFVPVQPTHMVRIKPLGHPLFWVIAPVPLRHHEPCDQQDHQADNENEFEELLRNKALARRLGLNGRARVNREYGAVQMSSVANVNNRPGIKYPESVMASLRSWQRCCLLQLSSSGPIIHTACHCPPR